MMQMSMCLTFYEEALMKITVLEIATGRTFVKEFGSIYLGEQWMKKRRRSNKLRIIDISVPDGRYERGI